MSKKKIDDLFHEKLKGFDEVPDEKVWKAIETSLDQRKKSHKVIPIWWKLGGVAALLTIVFYVINPFAFNESNENTITDIENMETPKGKKSNNQINEDFEVTDENTEKIAISPKKINEPDAKTEEPSLGQTIPEKNQVADSRKEKHENKILNQKPGNQIIAQSINSNDKSTTDIPETKKNDALINGNKDGLETVVGNSKEKGDMSQRDKRFKNKGILEEGTGKKEGIAKVDNQKKMDTISTKKSIFDEIAKQEEEEEMLIVENTQGKWSIGPNVAPVFFDSFGEGSPIHSNFASNSKSGTVNLSYGLSVSYEVSKKLSVRTGIHKVDYGYDTNDIAFSSSLDGSTNDLIDNIDYSSTSRNLVVQSKVDGGVPEAQDAIFEFNATTPTALEGRMVQEFGYLEVPIELNYALIDKKIGVNLVGGLSSLFLVDNSITLVSNGLTTEVGEANNINSVNFSTNIGFGVNYKFNPKVQLSVEPVFKYQLNTFSETAGNFNPFSVGIYSGINYKF